MSADGYSVDLDALRKLTDQLATGRDHLSAATTALGNAEWKDLGSVEVDRAAAAFHQSWTYGTKKLGDAAGSLVKGLQDTVTVYDDIEQTISHDLAACAPPPIPGSPAAPVPEQGMNAVTPISSRLAGGSQ